MEYARNSVNIQSIGVKEIFLKPNDIIIAYVLNAYGSGGKKSEFKYPRMIGRQYICLQAISADKKGNLLFWKEATSENYVTLCFF